MYIRTVCKVFALRYHYTFPFFLHCPPLSLQFTLPCGVQYQELHLSLWHLNLKKSCLFFLCCFKASGDPAWKSHWWQLYLHKSWIVAICWTRLAREDAWWPHCSQRYIFLILFFGVDDSETKSYFLKFRYEKINLDSVPLLLIKLVWKNLLPSLFHSLNLKTWSCFTKSKFVLVIDHPYHIFGLWFSKVKQTRDPFLQYLNFFNKSKKRCDMFFQT